MASYEMIGLKESGHVGDLFHTNCRIEIFPKLGSIRKKIVGWSDKKAKLTEHISRNRVNCCSYPLTMRLNDETGSRPIF